MRCLVAVRFLLLFVLITSACLSTPAARAAGAIAQPPQTPVRNVSNAYWGVTVRDPYRWLEDWSSADVSRWIDAQNAYANEILGTYPNRAQLLARLRRLALTGPEQARPDLTAGDLFFLRQIPPQAQPVLVVQPWPFGAQRVLVDTNPRGGLTSIEGFWPSMDGRYVAYATQEAGAESTTMHIVDVRRGRLMPDTLMRVGGGTSPDTVAWDADLRGFSYTRVPAPGTVPAGGEFFHSLLYHHALGTPQRADTLVLGRDFSPVAEWGAVNSEDGKLAAAFVHAGDGSYNDVFLRDASGAWRHVLGAAAGAMTGESETAVTTGAFVGQAFYVILTAGTPRGRVVALQGGAPRTIVPQGEWAMRSLASVKGGFLITEVSGADWRIAHYAADGRFIRIVPLPQHGIGIGDVVADAASSDALITYDGWTIPERWVRYNAATGAVSAPIFAMRPSADYSQVRFKVLYAISKDGSRVPVTVLYKDGTTNNGKAPALLTAYGGFGLTTAPGFIGSQLAWLERGGVVAVANIRGGGEYGEAWHLDGALTKKQNDYDDFTACARLLLASGWAAPGRLGIVGGSNGGLLMGAALTQHPELYRAVVSFAGVYDMLRVELTPNGRFNVSEFGTVRDRAQFRAMYDYSPYHNVRPGVRYPAVLMIAGENDPRVAPWQSRKMVARLQAATTSGYPVILLTRRSAGHGIGASFSQRLGDRGAEYLFFAAQLGLR